MFIEAGKHFQLYYFVKIANAMPRLNAEKKQTLLAFVAFLLTKTDFNQFFHPAVALRKLVANSSVVPQRPLRLRDR